MMREFFKGQFKALYRNTGLQQYEKMLDREDYENEFKQLLDALCRVCNQFDYIPNEDKQKIIRQNVLTDQEFTGFNARIVYKWLSNAKAIYFKEIAHKVDEPEEQKPILEGAARDAKLKEWLASLGDGMKSVPQLSPTEWKREGKIEVEKRSTGYVPEVDPAEWHKRDYLHKLWIKENFDPKTGEKLPTWIPESRWLTQKENQVE